MIALKYFCVILLAIICYVHMSDCYTSVKFNEISDILKINKEDLTIVRFIDVRNDRKSIEEYPRIDNSVMIPEKLIGLKFDNEDMYSKKNDPFILYGSEDAETQQAANKIEGLGYTNVYVVEETIDQFPKHKGLLVKLEEFFGIKQKFWDI